MESDEVGILMMDKVWAHKEYFFAVFAVFAWDTMAPISKILLNGYTNMEVLGYGSAIGAVILFGVILFRGEIHQLKEYGPATILKLALLGLFWIFFIFSILL